MTNPCYRPPEAFTEEPGNAGKTIDMTSQRDISGLLLGRTAAVFFGIGTILTVWLIVLHYWNFDFHHLTQTRLDLLAWGDAIGAIGVGTLFLGMCLFWGTCDESSKRSRRVWFFILLIGGALPYYFVVYLPAFKRRLKVGNHYERSTPERAADGFHWDS